VIAGGSSSIKSLTLLAVLWILVVAGFALFQPAILQPDMVVSVLQFSSMLALVALGQALLIISGAGVDLSVGGMVSLAVILTMLALRHGMLPQAVPVAAIAIEIALGAINGVLVTGFRILSLIATLGTMLAYGGLAIALSNGTTMTGVPAWLLPWGRQDLYGAPYHVLTAVAPAFLFAALMLGKMSWGRWILAMGHNERSARLVGISVDRVRFLLYCASGALAGIAALISLAWFGAGRPDVGQNLELESLAAVLLGGVSIAGGAGGVLGVLAAVVLVVTLQAALQFVNVSSVWQVGIVGLLLILVLLADLAPLHHRRRKLVIH
jgi:ribose transport system permease protein